MLKLALRKEIWDLKKRLRLAQSEGDVAWIEEMMEELRRLEDQLYGE